MKTGARRRAEETMMRTMRMKVSIRLDARSWISSVPA